MKKTTITFVAFLSILLFTSCYKKIDYTCTQFDEKNVITLTENISCKQTKECDDIWEETHEDDTHSAFCEEQ